MENTTQPKPMTLQEYTEERGDIAIEAVHAMYGLLCQASAKKDITRDEMLDAIKGIWDAYEASTDALYAKAMNQPTTLHFV
jgi:hypothetical protein